MKPIVLFLLLLFWHGLVWAQTFSGSGGSIPDAAGPVSFSIPVSGLTQVLSGTYGLKKVCLNINHTYDADLMAKLVSPGGVSITLFSGIGGGDDNFTGTCFDSSAATSIAAGVAPFTGTFRPQSNMGSVNNLQNGNGMWQLIIEDMAAVDTGSLLNWSIEFGPNAPTPFVVATDIPLVVITSNNINASYSQAQLKIIDNGIGNINHPSDPGNVYSGKVNIRVRGAFSSSLPQKPYAFTTINPVNFLDSNVSILGLPSEHDWILLATYNDKSFVRNPLMYETFRDMGHYAARSRYVEVVLNGEYQGIYSLMEKIKRDSNRVSIPKLTASDTTGDALTGGYIFKHDYPDVGWNSQYSAQPCNTPYQFNFEYPSDNNIVPKQANYIQHYLDTIEKRLNSPLVNDSIKGYRKYIHLNSFIDYMLLNEVSWNLDGFKKSMYFFKHNNGKDSTLHAGPIWDFDWALKITPWTPNDLSGWNYATDPCAGDVVFLPWWNIMMQDTFFQNKTKCRWEYHRKYALHTDSINKYIDKQVLYLQQATTRHYNYWQTLGINVGTPEVHTAATYAEEIDSLKSFIKRRCLWLDQHLPGVCKNPIFPSEFEEQGIDALEVYPNPANQTLWMRAYEGIEHVDIHDLMGRVIHHHQANSNAKEVALDVSLIPQGLYIIQVRKGDMVMKKKIVIIH